MLATLKAKIIIGIIITVLLGGVVWQINHWRNEAGKVPGLEKNIDDLKTARDAFKAKLDAQTAAAKDRIAKNSEISDNQNIKERNLINENAKSPSVIIPVDKLRALIAADSAAGY